MNTDRLILDLAGGKSVVDWFGSFPSFHDGEIVGISLVQGQTSSLSIHSWNTTDIVDANGYFVTDKHAVVTMEFTRIHQIELSDFDFYHKGIVNSLKVSGTPELTEVAWSSSVGVEGLIRGTGLCFKLNPCLAPAG